MIWFIEVNGLPFNARELPVEIQVAAYLKGVIPHVPGLGRDGTAATRAAQRSSEMRPGNPWLQPWGGTGAPPFTK